MQVKHKILLALAIMLTCMGLNFDIAYADEVSIVPVDTFELYGKSSATGYESQYIFEIERSCSSYPFTNNSNNFALGKNNQLSIGNSAIYLYRSGYGQTLAGVPADRCAYGYTSYNMPDFTVSFSNLVISLDMSDQLNGYYRYTCDFMVGVGFVADPLQYVSGDYDFTPSYTYNSAPLAIPDSEDGLHCMVYLVGEQEYSWASGSSSTTTCSLVHLRMESTFYFDSTYGTDITFNLSPVFSNMLGSLNFDLSALRATGRSQSTNAYYNNRVWSALYGNVEPPVTPTPTVTPYPGQDTQESINQGVQQIVQGLDVQATPIPTPEAFTVSPTDLEILETMTLPDLSDTSETVSSIWDIFAPAGWFIAALVSAILVTSIFLYVLRGGWL